MAKQDNTARNIAIGAAIAGAVGYIAGVLTAPKSGKETRADLATTAGELKDTAEHQLIYLQVELKDTLRSAKSKTMVLSGKAREEFNEAVVKAKDAQNKVTALLKAVKAGEADDPELNKAIKQSKLAIKNLKKYLQD
jgi:gas vesicle protein